MVASQVFTSQVLPHHQSTAMEIMTAATRAKATESEPPRTLVCMTDTITVVVISLVVEADPLSFGASTAPSVSWI
ncbi:hypothetical protein PC129_g9382 [Phytophthora cactorum]|uniref:Uncharacterized protein n=1 Tax=Phytophthora cactorum TaxID=29920 RepID=A0A8T0ZAK9_9STRA|nr:hypothetical protein PC112_g10215 [Phytophthora cactorum]KAG2825296.1 hypothetical protein PC111_g9452 [Phytophthora cactorum]KAG2859008.1 hypothetical protein PC113_g9294 [Phytophthora cactorum]KAG2905918.1 hypothetical protein PC114_g11342 [Phytophthora cactorum]KAG2925336.1 hypothetical protein PC115_g8273 [Phytophthora cactorum]